MYKRFSNIAIVSLMAIVIGIFSNDAFGQNKYEIQQKINYYDNLAQQWAKYRDQTVLPYYNDPIYYSWARSEYQKATQQIVNAQKYAAYYQAKYVQTEKVMTAGTETLTQECWVRTRGENCTYIYGRILWYDNGNVNRSDYDNKRNQMMKAGYQFMWAKEYSRKRFGESKYNR